jgi:glycosyltransferase involved in cell wall biosynthesis
MATIPLLAIGPNALLSLVGLLHGPDRTVPTPPEDWRQATVDVVIPARNEECNIALCLASLARQTLKPAHIILVDDGSSDRTIALAEAFCRANGMELIAIRRREAIGKTPTIKRQAREFDADVEFVIDADTVLESPNYLERVVQELYQAVGIASACGTVLPLRMRDRLALRETPPVQNFLAQVPDAPLAPRRSAMLRLRQGITNLYRETLYVYLQRFVYVGQMVFFGTIISPVGCAVAYRRKYIKELFDHYEPLLGDDLTNSEDIFIGFALLNEGYRNIQLTDVFARSQEPEAKRLPHQLYLWSSAFLQSCFYFNHLVASPFKALRRWRHQRETAQRDGAIIAEKRKIQEPYRQPFGREHTARYGRPAGWPILLAMVEKVTFPVVLFTLVLARWWTGLAWTVGLEILLSLGVLAIVAPSRRLVHVGMGLLIQPIRYISALLDIVTTLRFAVDVWIRRSHAWRK